MNNSGRKLSAHPKVSDFATWRRAFVSSLKVNTSAWKAFQRYLASQETFAKVAEVPWKHDCRGHALERLHTMTTPGFEYEKVRKTNAETRRLLKSVLPQLRRLAEHIQQTGTDVVLDDGLAHCDLSEVVKAYHAAQNAADVLHRPYARPPQTIHQCLTLLTVLRDLVPEGQAVALARLAMKAHGYLDTELDCLSEDKIRAGNIRKLQNDHIEKFCQLIGLSDTKRNK